MSYISLEKSVQPRYFISYSRAQAEQASQLKSALTPNAHHIWRDLEQIAIGDNWLNEIRAAIYNCDELILLLSDDSIQSNIVAEEINIAISSNKPVRPLIISQITSPIPDQLNSLHHLDLQNGSISDNSKTLANFLAGAPPSIVPADQAQIRTTLKTAGTRLLWPNLTENIIQNPKHPNLLSAASVARDIITDYPEASSLWLNSGLLHCVTENWSIGIDHLRKHANAANSFAGWYMLALHLNRATKITDIPISVSDEAIQAIENAALIGENPLNSFLSILYQLASQKRPIDTMGEQLNAFVQLANLNRETRSEYLRLYWNTRNSLSVLGGYEKPVTDIFKELVQG